MPEKESKIDESAKFDVEQKQSGTAASDEVKPVKSDVDYSIKKGASMGSELKQEKVAQAIAPSAIGSSASGMMVAFSGNAVSGTDSAVLGGRQGTPSGSNTREQSRYGKKIERTATKINYTPSEQFIRAYKESAPLAQAKDRVQGFNGNYLNDTFRNQKMSGSTPADLTYERSLDIIEKDMIYFCEGQQFTNKFDKYPAKTYDPDSGEYVNVSNGLKRKNYLATALHVKLNADGELVEFKFDETDITPVYNARVADKSNANALIFDNRIELQREALESKASNETEPNWSPLARAIPEPNATLALMHDFESVTGAEVFAATRKLGSALSFQLNRAVKDGMDLQTPGVEALTNSIANLPKSEDYITFGGSIHDMVQGDGARVAFRLGSPAAFIPLYDSPAKYNNKADLLLQPRSFKMHLATAINNDGPLHVNPTFVKAFIKNECFSTIDGVYDPTQPILMTDKMNIVHPFSFNAIGGVNMGYDIDQELDVTQSTAALLKAAIGYVDSDTPFKLDVIQSNGGSIFKNTSGKNAYIYYKKEDSDISFESSTIAASKSIVLYAKNFVNGYSAGTLNLIVSTDEATHAGYTKITLPAEYTFYIGITGIRDIKLPVRMSNLITNPSYVYQYRDNHNNYVSYVRFALIDGIKDWIASHNQKMRDVYGADQEIIIPIAHTTRGISTWDLILCAAVPFIANSRVKYSRDLINTAKNNGYPFDDLIELRAASEQAYENFTFVNSDEPLVLGKLNGISTVKWTMPEFFWTIEETAHGEDNNVVTVVSPWYINERDYFNSSGNLHAKEGECNMSWPSIRAGLKLDSLNALTDNDERQLRLDMDIITDLSYGLGNPTYVANYKYGLTTDGHPVFSMDESDFTLQALLSLPRQLGWVMDAPVGAVTPKACDVSGTVYSIVNLLATANMKSQFRAYSYMNDAADPVSSLLDTASMDITRSANFTQKWVKFDAAKSDAVSISADYGIVVGAGRCYDETDVVMGYTVMTPFASTDNEGVVASSPSLASTFRFIHDRLQVLPFIISPFDAVNASNSHVTGYDIYDIAYAFGLCGFRASDYTEDEYNRQVEVVNKGLLFTSDPWLNDSYLK